MRRVFESMESRNSRFTTVLAVGFLAAAGCRAEERADFGWTARLSFSGQVDLVSEFHPGFHAAYSGANSVRPEREFATARVLTLSSGFRFSRSTDVQVDVESVAGGGISNALGLAGFANLDAARSPTPGRMPYLARFVLRQVIGMGRKEPASEEGETGPTLPVRRVELRFGKFSATDFFDLNSVSGDSRSQFVNWTVDNNAAYDFAADTRGYTYGALVEFYDRGYTIRFMEALMPTAANGPILDWTLARSRSENGELEIRGRFLKGRSGRLRLLGYANHGTLGSYREAVDQFLSGITTLPDIEATRRAGRLRFGSGINIDQYVTKSIQAFGRWGWNEGQNESYAYSEVNHSLAAGLRFYGSRWKRGEDAVGITMVSNGISGDHRRYLQAGGKGSLLGDSNLNYRREGTLEVYYSWRVRPGIAITPDIERVTNPGYNRDRGPVFVASLRMHLDIDRDWFRRFL